VPIYLATAGSDIARLLPLVGLLSAAVLIGTVAGAPILRRLPDETFRRLLAILLILLGVTLIVGIGQ
jgi:uncharacterized membrane protein YfcA